MPATTVLSRVKSDFFALLIPGAFILVMVTAGFLVLTHTGMSTCIIDRVSPFFKAMEKHWAILIVMVFAVVYLVGILVRTIPVNLSDKMAGKLFAWRAKKPWMKLGYDSSFPYPLVLKRVKDNLVQGKQIADFKIPHEESLHNTDQEEALHNAYNYWKVYICSESEELFSFIRDMESTVRLFVGMFWAGIIGAIGYLVILGLTLWEPSTAPAWQSFAIVMLVISIIIFTMFGMNIRRVRVQECGMLFMSYLVLLQSKAGQDEKNKASKKNNPGPNPTVELLTNLFGRKS